MENYTVLCHSAIKITGSKTIYIDPFKITSGLHDADYIFCTHTHFDHYSLEDIVKIQNENTKIIVPEEIENTIEVEPDKEYEVDGIKFKTTYAYNEHKGYHPKENKWVGYIIELDGKKYYIAGDTDNIPEIRNIKCDVAFVPVGGKYTMNVEEAVELCNSIEAEVYVPTHYGLIVGNKKDGERFAKLLKDKTVKVFIK